jgi:hypothetical protein
VTAGRAAEDNGGRGGEQRDDKRGNTRGVSWLSPGGGNGARIVRLVSARERALMPFKPNYNLRRAERRRAQQQKQEEKQQRRQEKAAERKAARDDAPPAEKDPGNI